MANMKLPCGIDDFEKLKTSGCYYLDKTGFIEELLTEDVADILFDTISYFNYKEDFYQGFVAGLFSGAGYDVNSDIEQGKGRADIVVRDRRYRRALVIEAKWTKGRSTLEEECEMLYLR